VSHRTRIKFCGITRPADAAAAASAGADAIGIIFHEKSSRCVSVDQAREILAALPPMVDAVGLFVNAPPVQVLATVDAMKLRTVQLHGDEPPDDLLKLQGLTVIKAVHCTPAKLASLGQWHNAAGILLETASTAQAGGTGVANDWSLVESAIASGAVTDHPPLIAAGGLTPENVAEVIGRIRPWAVDVSTGIEESRGIKSTEKMRRFAEAVRRADGDG
jgi:phosphoribosylanthranilate isomerase